MLASVQQANDVAGVAPAVPMRRFTRPHSSQASSCAMVASPGPAWFGQCLNTYLSISGKFFQVETSVSARDATKRRSSGESEWGDSRRQIRRFRPGN